ncbi:hypothetical protein FIBSPDRAFT_199727 [Athelia psychrophila]|uniref:Uncharacterized protein n=1 Tax=Athelia psychrophila TaxID=1759441 RepID=A0A165ZN15_9AGAM|nr:hypothetical protein FIBSPDRAFT_199727 [Fibularhizoctonia sp. CBS 109695]
MPCTYISFQEQAEVAIFVDRTKSNMPFEDQLMLSPEDIEHNNIMGMRAALVEAENERRVKHSSGKKQVPVYREQHGKVSGVSGSASCNSSSSRRSRKTYLHPYSKCQVPASFQLVPEYVQPKTSTATLLKEKALKTLNGSKWNLIIRLYRFNLLSVLSIRRRILRVRILSNPSLSNPSILLRLLRQHHFPGKDRHH